MLYDDNEHTPEADEGDKMCGLANLLLYKICSEQTYKEVILRATERRIEFAKTRQQVFGVIALLCESKCMNDLTQKVHIEAEEEMRQQNPHLFNNSPSTMSALGICFLQNVIMERLSGTNNKAVKLSDYIELGYSTLLDDVIVQHDSSILGGSKVYYSWWQNFDAMLSKTYVQDKLSKYWKRNVNQNVLSKVQHQLRVQCYKLFQIPQPTHNFAIFGAVFCDTCHTVIHPIPDICIYCLYDTRSPKIN